MPFEVWDLQFDDDNEAEFGRHHFSADEILQVLDNAPVFFRNRKRHRTTLLMVGPTNGGRMLTVPLAAVPVEGVWRPATAWDSDADETLRYTAQRH
jgi:hypothetical protein